MSRPPKFRAWDKEAKELVYGVIPHPDGVVWRQTVDQYGEPGCAWFEIETDGVEQSTGLKDKNGVEIFEGDIVIVMGYGTYKVFWRVWDSSLSLAPIDTVKDETSVLVLCGDWEGDYEVIGNIHKDPELLER